MRFQKTDSGRAEIQQRHQGLSPRARQVLLLCDGQRSLAALAQMMPGQALEQAIEELRGHALIEPDPRDVELHQTEPASLSLFPMHRQAAYSPTPAQRYLMAAQAAKEMVATLGFAARFRAQLSIEKASTLEELSALVHELFDEATARRQNLRFRASLDKFRQLVSG